MDEKLTPTRTGLSCPLMLQPDLEYLEAKQDLSRAHIFQKNEGLAGWRRHLHVQGILALLPWAYVLLDIVGSDKIRYSVQYGHCEIEPLVQGQSLLEFSKRNSYR